MKKELFVIKSAFILSIGTVLAKIIGAIYRIPLTNILGSYGLGLYQMVFPIYTLFLDFSGAGTPNAISKIISSFDGVNKENYSYNIFAISKKILTFLGVIFTIFMALFSRVLSKAQGNKDCFLAYIFLSPSIIIVCIISSYRGYFQGLMDMKPTAVSQVIEQVVKLIFGLVFAYIFRYKAIFAVSGATFAITISEFFAFIFLLITFLRNKKKYNLRLNFEKELLKERRQMIVKVMIPVALVGVSIPFSSVIDSFMVINILSKYSDNATTLYGLLTGVANTIINLPVAVCYGIACALIPSISKEKNNIMQNKIGLKAIYYTIIFSTPFIICFLFFPNFIISMLFRRLSYEDKSASINLLKLLSINVLFISLLQTENSILIGKGKLYYPLISMSIGILVKIIVNYILLNNVKFGIYGGGIALISCYFTADLINLLMIFNVKVKHADKIIGDRKLQN